MARLALGGWALGTFAFGVAHPAWSERAILANVLTNEEQRVLWATLAAAMLAVAAVTAAHMLHARQTGKDLTRAFDALSRAAMLLVPLGLFPLYHADIAEHLVLASVAAIASSAAGALYLNLEDGSLRRWPSLTHVLRTTERMLPFVVVAASIVHVLVLDVVIRAHSLSLANGWDLAIHNQLQWNIVNSGVPWTTMYSMDPENHYSIHFSPILHLTALVYALRQTPDTLTTLQNVALACGALPLFLLARKKSGSGWIGLCLALSYLFNPCLHSIAVFEFHEIALLVPLVLWMVWAIEVDRVIAFWILVVAIFLVRDDTPIYLGAFAAYLWLTDRRRVAIQLGTVAAGYFVVIQAILMPALRHGPGWSFADERFADLQRAGEHGSMALLSTLSANPLFCIQYVVRSASRLDFTALVLLPVAFLPLRTRRGLILCAPGFLLSVLSSFQPQYSIWWHYTAPFLAFLYCAAIFGLVTLRPRLQPCAAVALLLCSLLLSGKYGRYGWLNPSFVARDVASSGDRYGHSAEQIFALARTVPSQDSVRATNNLLPVLSGRERAYIMPGGVGADWAFIDYRRHALHGPGTFAKTRSVCQDLLTSADYGVVYLDESVVVLRRGADRSKNDETLVQIAATDPD